MIRVNKIIINYLFILTLLFGSCHKFVDPPVVFEEEPELKQEKKRKVLIISIDGLSGLALQEYVPSNISTILEKSKYTLGGFADANTGDASTWATIVSGISSTKHGIHGNSFEEDLDEDDPHGSNSGVGTGYITFYQRILESGRSLRTLSATSMGILDQNVFAYSDSRIIKSNDEDVKNAVIDSLKNNDDRLSFAVINFRSVNDAGVDAGYSIQNASYKAALNVVDGYIGEMLTTIKNRKNYANEDWLIVITSNHGGLNNSYGGATFEERKIPIIFYNEQFKKYQYETPKLVNSLLINTKGNIVTPSISAAATDAYDLKNGRDYTIMFKVKNRVLPTGTSHAVILGRTTHAYSANRGWHFMVEGAGSGRYRALLGDGGAQLQVFGRNAILNAWETLALRVYYKPDGKRYATLYVNGVAGTERDIPDNRANFQTAAANFFVGSGTSAIASVGTFNGTVNDLVFIPRSLTDQEIQDFTCLDEINSSVPYWNDITGYWPMKEGSGTKFVNYKPIAANTDFSFSGSAYAWQLEQAWTCSPIANTPNIRLVNQIDIIPQVAYWLGIKADDSWKLEGQLFLNGFESEFLKD